MAASTGRGAQVRLDGDEQAAARGALGRRLHDNIEFKSRIERAGIAADGDGPHGVPGSGAEALDEVVAPGGRSYGHTPSALPGAPPGTTPGTTEPPVIVPPPVVVVPPVIISPNPNPPPATAITDRLASPIKTRGDAYLEFRIPVMVAPPVVEVPGTTPPVIVTPAGAIAVRSGSAITDRAGTIIQFRTVADSAVVVPVDPTPDPTPPPVSTFPTTPHLRLASAHGNVIVESQDGATAHVRLVRPIYMQDALLAVTHAATPLGNTNTFYSYRGPGDMLGIQNGNPAATRDILSTDDGTFTTQIFQGMSDGSFLQLEVTFAVAPTRTGTVPAPSAVPAKDSVIFFEDFAPNTGTGALNRTFGNITNTGNSTVLLIGRASAMTQTDPANRVSNEYGYPNGRYEFRCRYIGDLGNAAGPAIVLWPASDNWPGPEVDLGEFFSDGSMYMALHWKDGTKPVENNGQNQNTIWPIPKPFDVHAWHTYAADLLTDKCIFYIDGVEFARDNFSPAPKDFAHGGENHTLGLLSGSDASSDGSPSGLECDWIRFTPEALISA